MEYEGKFTEDDVDNDGEIKRYAGKQAAQVASRQNSDLYKMFINVCEDKGLEPWQVLGDHIVRALNNEDHAGMLANTDVNMSELKKGDIRLEDAKLLRKFAEELGVGFGDGGEEDELEKIFKDRLKSKLESPFSSVAGQGQDVSDESLKQEVRMLRSEIQNMKGGGGGSPDSNQSQASTPTSESRDIDEVFDEASEPDNDVDDGGTEGSEADIEVGDEEGGNDFEGEFEEDEEEDRFSLDLADPTELEPDDVPGSKDAEVEDDG